MVRRRPSSHTRGMESLFTQILGLAPMALLSVPIVIGSLVLVLLVGTGVAGRVATLLEDLRAGEGVEPGC